MMEILPDSQTMQAVDANCAKKHNPNGSALPPAVTTTTLVLDLPSPWQYISIHLSNNQP